MQHPNDVIQSWWNRRKERRRHQLLFEGYGWARAAHRIEGRSVASIKLFYESAVLYKQLTPYYAGVKMALEDLGETEFFTNDIEENKDD